MRLFVALFLAMVWAQAACPGSGSHQKHGSSDAGGMDMGTDAGGMDTGTDAGGMDASTDAGGSDASTDAGGSDASTDAGESDASTDAGRSDAGRSDAGIQCGAGPSSFPTFNRACTPGDGGFGCAVGLHQTDCCGSIHAQGIAASEAATFAEDEATCEAMYPACQCASDGVVTDDGSTSPDGVSAVVVECVANVCTTTVRPATTCYDFTCTPAQVCVPACEGVLMDGGTTIDFCVDVPTACVGSTSCSCYPSDPCPVGTCTGVQNGYPRCLCE